MNLFGARTQNIQRRGSKANQQHLLQSARTLVTIFRHGAEAKITLTSDTKCWKDNQENQG